jgi:hypothetical protein
VWSRYYRENMLLSFQNFGRMPPIFSDASIVANAILREDLEYDVGSLYFNTFR